jgi:hypothetical protein
MVARSPEVIYEVVSNLEIRHHWNKQAREILYEEGHVNHVGIKHRCLFDNGSFADIETISDHTEEGKLVFGERTENVPFTRELSTFWFIEKLEENKSKLTMEFHFFPKKPLGLLFGGFIKARFRKDIVPTLKEIQRYCMTYA